MEPAIRIGVIKQRLLATLDELRDMQVPSPDVVRRFAALRAKLGSGEDAKSNWNWKLHLREMWNGVTPIDTELAALRALCEKSGEKSQDSETKEEEEGKDAERLWRKVSHYAIALKSGEHRVEQLLRTSDKQPPCSAWLPLAFLAAGLPLWLASLWLCSGFHPEPCLVWPVWPYPDLGLLGPVLTIGSLLVWFAIPGACETASLLHRSREAS